MQLGRIFSKYYNCT